MNLRLKHRIYCLLILTTLAFSTASHAADKKEEVNENVEEWLDELEDELKKQKNPVLENILERVKALEKTQLLGYVLDSGLFCYGAQANLSTLSKEIKELNHFQKEFKDIFNNLESEADVAKIKEELIQQSLDKKNQEKKWYLPLCEWTIKKCSQFCGDQAEQKLSDSDIIEKVVTINSDTLKNFGNKVVGKSDAVFNDAAASIKANACNTQLKLSIGLWVSSATYIGKDWYYLKQVSEHLNKLQDFLETHLDKNNNIKPEETRKILISLNELIRDTESFFKKGQNKLEEFIKQAKNYKSVDKRQEFISTKLQEYIDKIQDKRDDIEQKIGKLSASVRELISNIDVEIRVCQIEEKQCEIKGIGQLLLAGANIFGAIVNYRLGNFLPSAVHGGLAAGNVVLAKWAYDEYCEIKKALVQLEIMSKHYRNLRKKITKEEVKVLTDFAAFIKEVKKNKTDLLKQGKEQDKEEDEDMDFDWSE